MVSSNEPPILLLHPINLQELEQDIRPFPATATKIIALCNSNETKIAEIAELIDCEPAVSVKILAMANSPLFGSPREITSVNHAIVLLGYKTVSQLALSIAAGPLFSSGNAALLAQRTKLFRASLGVATVSRLLAHASNMADPSEAFLGGMMLDVGKLFFFDIVPDPYLEILENNENGNTTDVEIAVFGTDHSQIGEHCGRKWGLPNQINQAIKNHHQSIELVDDGLTKVVLAGDFFAKKWELGFDSHPVTNFDTETGPVIEECFSDTDWNQIENSAVEQFQAIQSIFAI